MALTPSPEDSQFVRRVREEQKKSSEPGRHRARRNAMMALYQADVLGVEISKVMETFAEDHNISMPEYGVKLISHVDEGLNQIDETIQANLKEWEVSRLGVVERAILRIAVCEILEGDVPPPVVIDEAVILAKRYTSPTASSLINGVLSGVLDSIIEDVQVGEE